MGEEEAEGHHIPEVPASAMAAYQGENGAEAKRSQTDLAGGDMDGGVEEEVTE